MFGQQHIKGSLRFGGCFSLFFFGRQCHVFFLGFFSYQVFIPRIDRLVGIGAAFHNSIVADFAILVDLYVHDGLRGCLGSSGTTTASILFQVGISHMTRILGHMNLGEGPAIIKIEQGSRDKQFGTSASFLWSFAGGFACCTAPLGVRRDSFAGLCFLLLLLLLS